MRTWIVSFAFLTAAAGAIVFAQDRSGAAPKSAVENKYIMLADGEEIADKDGSTRISMGTNKDNLAEFTMVDKSGNHVARMAQVNDH